MDNFKNVQKKIFQNSISGIFFKEIKYYKDFVKNEWGFNILCECFEKSPEGG